MLNNTVHWSYAPQLNYHENSEEKKQVATFVQPMKLYSFPDTSIWATSAADGAL
jgi:hypothetical protein